MASNKALPAPPQSLAPIFHLTSPPSYEYLYEDPRALWVHHRKTPLNGPVPGSSCGPRHGGQDPRYREPSRGNGLGIRVPDSGYAPPRLRRATRTVPAYTALPPSPEDSPLEVLPLFARQSPLHVHARHHTGRAATWRSTSSPFPRPSAAAATLENQGYRYGPAPAPADVSPPSSPEVGHANDPRSVSPVDDVPDMPTLSRPRQSSAPAQPKSNIPMMRRQRRHEQDAANAALRESKSRERLRSSSLQQQPTQDGQDGGRDATGRQVFKMAQGADMRWDAMTGEPTLGSAGVEAQVKPAEYAQGLKTVSKPASSTSAALERLRNAQSSFGEKVRKLTSPTSPTTAQHSPASPGPESASSPTTTGRPPRKASLGGAPAPRPEWKGASGRTALVEPVQDTPQAGPLQIPRKSSKRDRNANKSRGARGGPGGPLSLSPISPSASETSLNRADPSTDKVVSPQQATPSPNLDGQSAGREYPSPPHSGSPAPPSHAADPGKVSPTTPTTPVSMGIDNAKATRRKPPSAAASHHAPHFSTASSVYSTFDTTTVPQLAGASNVTVTTRLPKSSPAPDAPQTTTAPAEDNWVPPPSRFSITTYATSAHTRSPNASIDLDAPPVPTPPQTFTQPPPSKGGSPPEAHMSSAYTSPAAEVRRAAALGHDGVPSYMQTGGWPGAAPSIMSERPGSVASTSKALPLAPPEMQTAHDRVGHLNARLESLANRRININKSIVKMTELMPTDNLMASDAVLRKREAEKLKVENLKAELAEVQRLEYELGLKLHRAYKRQDRDAEYEPTTLWVRRVTGS